ncbi:MAG: MBL fold metallo-hydrolase [Nocardioidaceae bacterium]|nr:MBL fold metallo-hydrolase [Nocardioidaceae bacterium]
MTYTGRTHVGGTPQVRELAHLMVTKVSVGPMDNSAYLLRCRGTGEQLLIDAAADEDTLLSVIGADALARVVTTHHHADHWQALEDIVSATGAQTVAGHRDAAAIPVATDVCVRDGEVLNIGDCALQVIELVGHTPGSIGLLYDDPDGYPHLFTGDSLFPGGPGKTPGPDEFTSLMDDLEAKVFARLPDETWVYPGHGDDTTLGAERPHLAEWRERGW